MFDLLLRHARLVDDTLTNIALQDGKIAANIALQDGKILTPMRSGRR
ncbi:hypothetical protein LTSEGIV_5719 [Salmonella enterica subsp. enterica serovar Give str. S5-487]|nr:hypothetical protein LTSEGIV_5719 [Salmonella enterica subsp. enterica serovar Give str. S5-487]